MRNAPVPTPRNSYLARVFDDDNFAWTRMALTRKRLVIAEAVLLTVLFVTTLAAVATSAGWVSWLVAAWTVGLLAFMPVHSFLNAGIRGLYDRSGGTLDEHQRQVRNDSHAAVRWLSFAFTLAAWIGAATVVSLTDQVRLGLATGFLLWITATLLPYWHLGWVLPDEYDDDLEHLGDHR